MPTTTRAPLDLLDADLYLDDPYSTYAWYREHQPVAWDAVNELWGVFRYADVVEVEDHDEVFISSGKEKGGYRPNIPADAAIIGLDNPVHAKRRALVNRWFTPRAVASREERVREVVTELLDAALAKGTVEVINDLAAQLPARMIGWLLGFPDDLWPQLKHWSEVTIALGGGPRYLNDEGQAAAQEFTMRALALYAEKKQCPADDVMTAWTKAEIDGEPLGLREVGSDCLLLLDGGAETTRTVIARTLLNLVAHPDQWERLRAGVDMQTATEEFIRFVTPIHNMCRTAVRAYDLGGVTIEPGQQVMVMYGSANRDPARFTAPERFDVTRANNLHLSFGFGPHFCLGAGLARLEIRVFFEELARRVRTLKLVPGSVVEQHNAFVYGILAAELELS